MALEREIFYICAIGCLRKSYPSQVLLMLRTDAPGNGTAEACAHKAALQTGIEKFSVAVVAVLGHHKVERYFHGVDAGAMRHENAGHLRVAQHKKTDGIHLRLVNEARKKLLYLLLMKIQKLHQVAVIVSYFEDVEKVFSGVNTHQIINIHRDDKGVEQSHRVGADQKTVSRKGDCSRQVDPSELEDRVHSHRHCNDDRGSKTYVL